MKLKWVMSGIAALLLILVIIPGVQAAETYGYVTQWGSHGSEEGQFISPSDIAVDTSGNVYVLDTGNFRIQKFDSEGQYLKQWGSQGPEDGQFTIPSGIAVDASDNVFVLINSNSLNYRIKKFDSEGNFVTKWDFDGSACGHPYSMTVDNTGNFYVVDGATSMCKFDSDGHGVWTVGGNKVPIDVTVDSSDNVYVLALYAEVVKYDSTGIRRYTWGGSGGMGDGELSVPCGITVDSSGDVYVADTLHHRIQKFDSNGEYITKWGFEGTGNGQFSSPARIAVDPSGNVYVLDQDQIKKFAEMQPGSISVTSDPAGAAIKLDGIDTGQLTPFTFDTINPGEHLVDVRLAGYFPATKTVPVTEGSTSIADFRLQIPQVPSIAVSSVPVGVKIWIDGVDTGEVTPFIFEKDYGTYIVSVGVPDSCFASPAQTVTISSESFLATAHFSLNNWCPIPEFPTMFLPVTLIIAFLGTVLFIRRTKEK